jgi:hypothetical protein
MAVVGLRNLVGRGSRTDIAALHECLVAHAESRLGNREALDIADWMSVVALSTLSGRSGASPHLRVPE